MSAFHPDLAGAAPWLPRFTALPATVPILRWLMPKNPPLPRSPSVTASLREVPGATTARVFVPNAAPDPRPLLLWVHGGGFVIGAPGQDDASSLAFAEALGVTVVAPSYRLAPEHPYPAALDDLYAALTWARTTFAPTKIVLAGASAGGGLAAGLALLARDRGEIPIAAQILRYPMLDDRTVDRTIDGANHRVWNARCNRYGWASYLGGPPGGADIPIYAAPARAEDLRGLPPTWIGVGTFDLFHDEDVAYAERLRAAGVPVTLEVVLGAFHGFDAMLADKPVSRRFFEGQVEALRGLLSCPAPTLPPAPRSAAPA